jgi:hypothetical protein
MQNLIFIITFKLLIVNLPTDNELKGTWHTGRNNTLIEIYNKDNALYGKVISSDNPEAPVGKDVLEKITRDGDTWKGTMYSWKKDRRADVTLETTGNSLKIKIDVGLFPFTLLWERKRS